MKKIFMIGQFPGQLNGLTIANQTLEDGLKENYKIEKIDLSICSIFEDKKEHGKFKIKKFCIIIYKMLQEIIKLIRTDSNVVYITPGQSFLGFMRLSPYMLVCILRKIPYYNHIHGGYFRKMYDSQSRFKQKLLNFFIKKSTGMIVLGESLKNMFRGILPENKIFICENGVQDNIVATESEIKEKIERYKKDTKKRVLYLSNLMEEKGILDLLKASEKFNEDEAEFNLAGEIEPSIKNKIEIYLKKYPKKIKYYGVVRGEEKKKLLLENYIFILPTYYSNEGQPISILEAYVNGCAVITDDTTGGIKDIFKDNVNGLCCRGKNVKSIFEAIKFIQVLKHMEENYLYGKNNFIKDNFVKKIIEIITLKEKYYKEKKK